MGFAYAKPTIPEALQLLLGEYQENGCAGRILAESVRKGKAVDSQPGAVREKARAPHPQA